MAIRTPRPRPVSEDTLIGGLANRGVAEQERRRVQELEDRARDRRERFEDLQFRGEEQRQGAEFQTFLRNVRGEEIVGGGGPVPGTVTDFSTALQPRQSLGQFAEGAPPDALAPRPGALTSLEGRQEPAAGAVGATRRREQARRRGAILEPARATRPQFQQSEIRRLDPDRDPTQLVRREPAPAKLGFGSIEQRLGLPSDSLEQAFQDNPVGTLNFLKDDIIKAGGGRLSARELNDLRLLVTTRVDAIKADLEFILDNSDAVDAEGQMQALSEEMTALTVGLIQAAVGSEEFSPEDAADEIDRLFPTEDRIRELMDDGLDRAAAEGQVDEEKAQRLLDAVRAAGAASAFGQRARGSLESGR